MTTTGKTMVCPPAVPRCRRWPARADGDAADRLERLAIRGLTPSARKPRDGRAAILGCGAVGARALAQLVRLGIGAVLSADPDCYDEDSWITQPAVRGQAGGAKVWVQAEFAHAINPATELTAVYGFAQDLPLGLLRRCDVWLVAGDNLELPVWAGRLAAGLGKTLLQGAVHGETWSAFVRSYDLHDPAGPCPACALRASDWGNLRAIAGCEVGSARLTGTEPTRTLPFVCGTAAELLAAEAAKQLTGDPGALRNEELAYCLKSHRAWRSELPRNPACKCPHTAWRLVDVAAEPAEQSLSLLLCRPELEGPGDGDVVWQVRGEQPWVSFAVCGSCDRRRAVRRFARPGRPVGRCDCGETLVAAPPGLRAVLPADDLLACRTASLSELGVGPGGAIGVNAGEGWAYFFLAGEPQFATAEGSP
jgi:molybdopterin/thiamine biosynthesis adenylyltransferase